MALAPRGVAPLVAFAGLCAAGLTLANPPYRLQGLRYPGMILAAHQLLLRNPRPSEGEIRHGLEGNLCRCTGYQNIVKAVQYAATKR